MRTTASQASVKMAGGSPEYLLDAPETYVCNHNHYCNTPKRNSVPYCLKAEMGDCQTARFWNRNQRAIQKSIDDVIRNG